VGCRDKWFAGERQSKQVEKDIFQRLLEAIYGLVIREATATSAADSTTEKIESKDATVEVERVMTDDESIYADAEEILCF
jgi:hypothetical protein